MTVKHIASTLYLHLDMSKYEKLLQSLRCQWSSGPGSQCGEGFSNASALTEHLRSRHIPSFQPEEEGAFECHWEGCGQVILGPHRSYVLHVLGHPYHCFLKLRGSELQVLYCIWGRGVVVHSWL